MASETERGCDIISFCEQCGGKIVDKYVIDTGYLLCNKCAEAEVRYMNDVNEKPVRINAAHVEVDIVPLSEAGKLELLKETFLPLLYAFDGAPVTFSVELTPVKH